MDKSKDTPLEIDANDSNETVKVKDVHPSNCFHLPAYVKPWIFIGPLAWSKSKEAGQISVGIFEVTKLCK